MKMGGVCSTHGIEGCIHGYGGKATGKGPAGRSKLIWNYTVNFSDTNTVMMCELVWD
jgi:hypothetical protein